MTAALAGPGADLGLWLWRRGGGGPPPWPIAAAHRPRRSLMNTAQASQLNGRLPWSQQAVAELPPPALPVFVDVTADWCITCLAERSAVSVTEDMSAAAPTGVATWWLDQLIAASRRALLRRHRRYPHHLMYPADPAASHCCCRNPDAWHGPGGARCARWPGGHRRPLKRLRQ